MFLRLALPFGPVLALLGAVCLRAEPPKLRLPADAKPVRQSVDLTLLPGEKTFHGSVSIEVQLGKPSTVLWLNSAELNYASSSWEQNGKTTQLKAEPAGGQFVGFTFPTEVSGSGRLSATFTGKVVTKATSGIFELKDIGTPHLFSQFEAIDARRAFPCFDEPRYKIPWQLTLHTRRNEMALSNTDPVSEANEPNGMKATRFAATRPLPSYLVAFAVGPFEAVPAGMLGKTRLRIITPKGRASEAAYAAKAIPALLKLLEDYFGSQYPFPKLDSVALPVSELAMENPGLITYPQADLLSSPEKDTIERQRFLAVIAAHEMAHQWFGDLVTTAWWDDIWLNEAFASWMEEKILDTWKPEWRSRVSGVSQNLSAMRQDSLVTARKIRQQIESNDDISNAFDSITYLKGSAVIGMFEQYVGAGKFRDGVRAYMKKYADSNGTTAQFLTAISLAAGKDVSGPFGTFLDQAGVPMLTVALHCANGAHPKVRLSQQRYLPLGSPGSSPQTWRIPVCVRFDSAGKAGTQCELLTDPRSEIDLHSAKGCPAWLEGNAGANGYYRVRYENGLLAKVMENGAEHLSVRELVSELGNAQAMVNSGDLPAAEALRLVPIFANHTNREVVVAASQLAGVANPPYLSSELQAKAALFIRNSFGARARALSWTPKASDDEDTRILRENLVPLVARAGEDGELTAQAERLAKRWLENHQSIDPGLAGAILSTAARTGGEAYLNQLIAALDNEKDSRTRNEIFGALRSFRDPALIARIQSLALASKYDARESIGLIFGGADQPQTRDLPFEFVKAHIDQLEKSLPRSVGGDYAAYLPFSGSQFCDAEHRDQLGAFFSERVKNYSGGPRLLAQTLESIDVCIGKRKTLEPSLIEFLNAVR